MDPNPQIYTTILPRKAVKTRYAQSEYGPSQRRLVPTLRTSPSSLYYLSSIGNCKQASSSAVAKHSIILMSVFDLILHQTGSSILQTTLTSWTGYHRNFGDCSFGMLTETLKIYILLTYNAPTSNFPFPRPDTMGEFR